MNVTIKTNEEPTHAERIPALAALRHGKLLKKSKVNFGYPSRTRSKKSIINVIVRLAITNIPRPAKARSFLLCCLIIVRIRLRSFRAEGFF